MRRLTGVIQTMILKQRGRASRRFGIATASTLALSLGLSAVASDVKPKTPTPVSTPRQSRLKASGQKLWNEIGKASWYGLGFQGKKTANGEKFDMNTLTCAHRTLPLGSWLRVTNLKNRHSALVRVNDRGPMSEGLIVDLSYAAARAVGISSIGHVKIETVQPQDPELARALVTQLQMPLPLIPLHR